MYGFPAASAIEDLAYEYQNQGYRLEDALLMQKIALDNRVATFGTVKSRNLLASLYQSVGRINESVELIERTWEVIIRRPGIENVETLSAMEVESCQSDRCLLRANSLVHS